MYKIWLLASDTSMCGRTETTMDVRTSANAHPKDTCQTGSHSGNNTVPKLPDFQVSGKIRGAYETIKSGNFSIKS